MSIPPIHVADRSLFRYDERATEKRVGLIVLATDHSVEPDFARLVSSERVGIFSTRVQYANPTTPDNLRKMAPRLTEAAALILPDEELDVVCFMCTSASVVIGNDAIRVAIQQAKPGVPVVTPTMAAVAGLRKLGARRISVLTPYTLETSEPMAAYFAAQGFSIESFTCLGLEDDRRMAELSRDTLIEEAVAATSPDADALFISCTALRSASVVAKIEARINRPVVSSNQASAWACLTQCGLPGPSSAVAGSLFA
ncbi:ectoine utilization protein EutA [Exophiala spinifera]|uniref:Ectoine utilization protein EutA n=1 Tax=Exophiala spinifera TaxID=91928 RepID=A0A0D2A5Q9_9EURO|nr:ectoine utilization protein EutA [Exophiala spinifera]KIW20102.1 ectoine utilization protein EutA [Exophiala spinifera]